MAENQQPANDNQEHQPAAVRDYLVSERQIRIMFISSAVLGAFIIIAYLAAASTIGGARYVNPDRAQYLRTLEDAAEDLSLYEASPDNPQRVRISIDQAIARMAERGLEETNLVLSSSSQQLAQVGNTPAAPARAEARMPAPVTRRMDSSSASASSMASMPSNNASASAPTPAPTPAPTSRTAPSAVLLAGESAYIRNCSSCHQANGQGLEGIWPSLVGHSVALYEADRNYLVLQTLYGVQGAISANGHNYNGIMPAWRHLSDNDIADILNYILTAWDNNSRLPQGFTPYSPRDIAAQRDQNLSADQVYARRPNLASSQAAAPATSTTSSAPAASTAAPTPAPSASAAPAAAAPVASMPAASNFDWQQLGATTYAANCSSCHQASGQGIPGAFPPLAQHTPSLYNADRDYLVNVLLYGLMGQINAKGMNYNGVMPAWQQLSDAQIAATLNHIVTEWGNESALVDFRPYTPDDIAAARGKGISGMQVSQMRSGLSID